MKENETGKNKDVIIGEMVSTYTPGLVMAIQMYRIDAEFRKLVSSGRFLYVDGSFCRADTRYVAYCNGKYKLTEYALENKDECLIRFDTPSNWHEILVAYYSILLPAQVVAANMSYDTGSIFAWLLEPFKRKYLRKKLDKAIQTFKVDEPEDILVLFHGGGSTEIHAHYLSGKSAYLNNILGDVLKKQKLIETISFMSFGDALSEIMKWTEITVEELEEYSGINEKKIKNLRGNKVKTIYRQDVLALVVGMHLSPPIGEMLFSLAKIQLGNYDKEDIVYKMILGFMFKADIETVNEILDEVGCLPIPRKIQSAKKETAEIE